MKITANRVIRWSGLSAVLAGILFIVIQAVHPPEIPSSVTTSAWAIVHYLTLAMSLLGLLGITGIYARQVHAAGWTGLAGFLLFGLFWAATAAFTFVEAFVLPVIAADAPDFVEGYLGIFTGSPSVSNLGLLPGVAHVGGGLYVLGGLLLGIATFRAGIIPRWTAVLLACAAVSTLASSLLPHPLDRVLAVPMGLALAGMGYAVWSDRNIESSAATSPKRYRGEKK
ncbi:hypothetical protein FHS19_002772 [Paenibacillus rhizosphaerae]|uniref:DUF4386 domain-containing protein n=1 Tax=Paenibacillus rhizosphaerae TaxID=297318 RepID=A0A839TRU0_9BACL|nr:hypothetical protein [Paenibacillus rhizosphaerae]MBB3128118.1 hypothetical protein [Paenibacillus rhizosphaerae]